jgi:hypothetical protein
LKGGLASKFLSGFGLFIRMMWRKTMSWGMIFNKESGALKMRHGIGI